MSLPDFTDGRDMVTGKCLRVFNEVSQESTMLVKYQMVNWCEEVQFEVDCYANVEIVEIVATCEDFNSATTRHLVNCIKQCSRPVIQRRPLQCRFHNTDIPHFKHKPVPV